MFRRSSVSKAAGAVGLLLVALVLSVYKPRALTSYGQRRQGRPGRSLDAPMPRGGAMTLLGARGARLDVEVEVDGAGPLLVIVSGAAGVFGPLAPHLAAHWTVLRYDRRTTAAAVG